MSSIPLPPSSRRAVIHPLLVRIVHWINAVAMLTMISSGWQIYNASPLFGFTFPKAIVLGGWLAGGIQWHFAAMWMLVANGLVYLSYGVLGGHFKRDFLPLPPRKLINEFFSALRGKLPHQTGVYNTLQRAAYLGVVILGVFIVLSGLSIWKPVQFKAIAALFGGYEGARLVHFFCMLGLVLFIVIHVVMVMLVPKTFLPMITGRAPKEPS